MAKRRGVRLGAALACGAAIVLVPLGASFACTPAAELTLATTAAVPGAHVTGTGNYFSSAPTGTPAVEPVEIHFNARTGPVLWSGRTDPNGTILVTFVVPDAAPGQYLIIATQKGATGQAASGTPVRVPFEVLAAPTTTPTTTTTTTTQPPPVVPEPGAATQPATESLPPAPSPRAAAPEPTHAGGVAAPRPDGSVGTTAPTTDPAPGARSRGAASVTASSTAGSTPASTTTPSSAPAPQATTAPETGRPAEGGARPVLLAAERSGPEGRPAGTWAPVLVGVVLLVSIVASVGVRRSRSLGTGTR